MYHKEKIIIMSKLAVYDKNRHERDTKKEQYFRHDYIYRQNMWTRLFAGGGCLILALFYYMYRVAFEGLDVMSLDIQGELTKILIFIIIVLIFYTILGTIQYTAEFQRTKKRLDAYYRLLNELDNRDESRPGRKRPTGSPARQGREVRDYGDSSEYAGDDD